jgi:serine O-acetyltransferase
MHDLLLEKVRARSGEFKTLLPTKDEAGRYVTGLLALLFARSHGVEKERSALWLEELAASQKALTTLLEPFAQSDAAALSETFYKTQLPQIYDVLWQDAEAAYAGDPAAQNLQEVVLAYPGFFRRRRLPHSTLLSWFRHRHIAEAIQRTRA